MDIHVLTPEEVGAINEALDAIRAACEDIVVNEEDDASPMIKILNAQDRIRDMLATRYYIFRCFKCGQLHATTASDIRLMKKPCHRCEGSNTLGFVDRTTVKPENCITRGTF